MANERQWSKMVDMSSTATITCMSTTRPLMLKKKICPLVMLGYKWFIKFVFHAMSTRKMHSPNNCSITNEGMKPRSYKLSSYLVG